MLPSQAEVFLDDLKEKVAKTLTELYKNETLPEIWNQTMNEVSTSWNYTITSLACDVSL